jgi:dynein heavy chain
VDKTYRALMTSARGAAVKPLPFCADAKLRDRLLDGARALDGVQKALADYLETKRLAFPRFFFLRCGGEHRGRGRETDRGDDAWREHTTVA